MKNGGDKYKTIRAIPWPLRKAVPLIVGNKYFFSFGNGDVRTCTLIDIIEEQGWPLRVVIEPDVRGVFGFRYHTLFADEVALSEKQAVQYEVTW